MSRDDILLEAEMSMEKSVDYLVHEFSGVRTGKASPALVENIDVQAYGSTMKLKQLALITTPELSEERRKELAKSLGKMAEEARVRVRSNRRTALDEAKKLKTGSGISEDELRDLEDEIQKLTDRFVKSIDDHLKHKETEIMKV